MAPSAATSFFVRCGTQAEVDAFWSRLCEGGAPGRCGWLTDRFGVSWQVVPKALMKIMREQDAGRRDRVMAAFMQMKKFDIATLERAREGE